MKSSDQLLKSVTGHWPSGRNRKIKKNLILLLLIVHLPGHNWLMAKTEKTGESMESILAEGKALLERMGLADRMENYPHQLSGGQQQRVAIARALAMKPDILCFDEPTSALDPELTGEVLKVIRGLALQHTTMIIVTHEMAFARDVADQVIFMDGGVIVEQGPARDVIDNPQQERTRHFLARYSQQ